MVKRNLRKRTKKVDYQKLNTTGVDKELISGGEPAITSSEIEQDGGDQNKQTIEHDGGTSWESVSDAECEVILPGDKLSSAEKRLRDLKNERNKLIEKEKSDRIARETKEVEEELRRLKGKNAVAKKRSSR